MCNHDVPTDGIDATVLLTVWRAYYYRSIRSSGRTFPIFQDEDFAFDLPRCTYNQVRLH